MCGDLNMCLGAALCLNPLGSIASPKKPTAAGIRHGWAGWAPRPGLSPLHLGMPLAAFGTWLRLNADRSVTAVRGRAALHTGWMQCCQPSLQRAFPQQAARVASGAWRATSAASLRGWHSSPWFCSPPPNYACGGVHAQPCPEMQSGTSSISKQPPGASTTVLSTKPQCPRDSRTCVRGFPAGRARQRKRKKKDEFLLWTWW